MNKDNINPITRLDYPDPDVIRVDNTYYMVSTTMYFMPGCEILRSYDLLHWEHASYVYDRLDSTPAQQLEGKENIYGQGMWAASLRYHQGIFYICFVCNDTHKTYIYQSKSINGPWEKYNLKGFYHDNSILFDDDGKIYIVSGNKEIYLQELELVEKDSVKDHDDISTFLSDDKAASPSGKIIIKDSDDVYLGYEGTHFYKIGGKYYLFFIHMPKSTGKRTEAVFVSDKPQGPYIGKDVMYDDRGYRGSGVAQGGIVDTPSGKWYSILFQDSGAVGRIPVLMPVHFEYTVLGEVGLSDDSDHSGEKVLFPVFGDKGIIPESFDIEDLNPGYEYTPLVSSDDFKLNGASLASGDNSLPYSQASFGFKACWQFNHEPNLSLIKRDYDKGTVTITTGKLSSNLVQARNTLTQRTLFPECKCSVMLDGSVLNDGDYAGLCVLESNYRFIGITRQDSSYYLVLGKRDITSGGFWGERHDDEPFEELEKIKIDSPVVFLSSYICYDNNTCDPAFKPSWVSGDVADDHVVFGYKVTDSSMASQLGASHSLQFKLDHFTGARFGLFVYSTAKAGGSATFSNWLY